MNRAAACVPLSGNCGARAGSARPTAHRRALRSSPMLSCSVRRLSFMRISFARQSISRIVTRHLFHGPPPATLRALSRRRPLSQGCRALRAVLSESGLIRERIRIEAAWLLHLAESVPQILAAAAAGRRCASSRRARARAGRRRGRGGQGHRSAHQPRREGRRVLRAREARAQRRDAGGARARALRLHLRGHQQPRATRACCARRAQVLLGELEKLIEKLRGFAHEHAALPMLVAHARPDREPDHARQGNRERRRAPAARPRALRQGRRSSASGTARSATTTRTSRRCPRSTGRRSAATSSSRRASRTTRTPRRSSRTTGSASTATRSPRSTPSSSTSPRHLGLHLARLLPPARGRRRGRLLDHAAQGQPDRLRERRRQSRRRQRAAAPLREQAADLALAARPHRLDRAAQRRRGAGAQR